MRRRRQRTAPRGPPQPSKHAPGISPLSGGWSRKQIQQIQQKRQIEVREDAITPDEIEAIRQEIAEESQK